MKSVLKRRAQQQVAKRRLEVQSGSLADLDDLLEPQPDAEQQVYARELLECLSPFARSIANRRWLGYSWREIADSLEMDHTVVRRAYFEEVETLLNELSRSRGGRR